MGGGAGRTGGYHRECFSLGWLAVMVKERIHHIMRSVHPKLHTATRSPYVQGMGGLGNGVKDETSNSPLRPEGFCEKEHRR